MVAFAFSVSIFLSCFVVGYSVLSKSHFPGDRYLNLLLSPILGLGILICLLNFLNRLGLPVKDLAWPLLGLVVITLILSIRRIKQTNNGLKNLLLLVIFPCVSLFAGWPILRYSFNWLSYVNDDMNLYVSGATRFYSGGFYVKPLHTLLGGTDYSQSLYHFYVTLGSRPGSELLLAFVSAFNHGNPLPIFMLTILALQMILIATIVAFVRVSLGAQTWKSVVALLLATVLPLINLGFLYQLIAQVGGLSFALGTLTLVTILLKRENDFRQIRMYIFLAILISGQLIWYPEVLPFIVMPVILMYLLTHGMNRRRLWLGSMGSVLLSLLILNRYFFQAVRYSLSQVASTTNANVENKLQVLIET